VARNGDRITFTVSGVIRLTSGGLVVARNVAILGPGANQLSIDGNQATFVVAVIPQKTVSISGLSITNGQYGIYNQQGTLTVSNCVVSGNSFAGLYNDASQSFIGASMTVTTSIISNTGTGAINVLAPPLLLSPSITSGRSSANQSSPHVPCACMTITDSVVSNNAENGIYNLSSYAFSNGSESLTVVNSNVSDNGGSGIGNHVTAGGASATIVSSTVSGNSAGGIFTSTGAFGAARVTVTDSTISSNSAYGGIHGGYNLTVTNSTISGNSAGESGGGIYSVIGVSIENSTISGNSAGTSGGGIYNTSSLYVKNSTITGNSAGSGGGIYNDRGQSVVEISNTILNAGALGANIFNSGAVTSIRLGVLSRRKLAERRPISRRDVSPQTAVAKCGADWRYHLQAVLRFVDPDRGNRCLVWDADLGLEPRNDLAEDGDLFRARLARADRPGHAGIQPLYLFHFLAR
jgi:predicted outer membrane repeat protein